jgi:hypothetical protein
MKYFAGSAAKYFSINSRKTNHLVLMCNKPTI